MSKEHNIKRGGLSEKMSTYHVNPPEEAWKNISAQLNNRSGRRVLFIAVSAAAGLALAITIGINLLQNESVERISDLQDSGRQEQVTDNGEINPVSSIESSEEVNSNLQENIQAHIETPSIKSPGRFERKVLASMDEVISETESLNEREPEVRFAEKMAPPADSSQIVEPFPDESSSIDSVSAGRILDSMFMETQIDLDIEADIEPEGGKWQLGANLSPIYSYRDAASPDMMQNNAANNAESGRITYSGGLHISYLPSDRLVIESGIYYSKIGLAIGDFSSFLNTMDFWVGQERYNATNVVSLSNSIGTIVSSHEDVIINTFTGAATDINYSSLEESDMVVMDDVVNSFVQNFEYLEIPFNLKYKLLDRKLQVLLVGGVSTNLLVGNHVSANTESGKVDYGTVQDIKNINYTGNAGLGFIYNFPGNFSLSIEPRFRYYLNSVNASYLPVTRPYTMGVYTGVNYRF